MPANHEKEVAQALRESIALLEDETAKTDSLLKLKAPLERAATALATLEKNGKPWGVEQTCTCFAPPPRSMGEWLLSFMSAVGHLAIALVLVFFVLTLAFGKARSGASQSPAVCCESKCCTVQNKPASKVEGCDG